MLGKDIQVHLNLVNPWTLQRLELSEVSTAILAPSILVYIFASIDLGVGRCVGQSFDHCEGQSDLLILVTWRPKNNVRSF